MSEPPRNPFGERADNLAGYQRAQLKIAEAWAFFANGVGADPRYFDYQT